MQNNIHIYESGEFGKLEVLMIDEKPYLPATECAALLGYAKPHNAVSRHCRASLKRGAVDALGRAQEKLFIPEGDVYRLIAKSKLPAALRFESWVFDTVLPSIRANGAYIADDTLRRMREDGEFADGLMRRLAAEREKNGVLSGEVQRLTPKAKYYDIVLRSADAVQASILAKEYGLSCIAFNKLLNKLGVQYRIGKTWLLYQKYQGRGYTVTNTYERNGMVTFVHTLWTQKGRYWLYTFLKGHGVMPEAEKQPEKVQMTLDEAEAYRMAAQKSWHLSIKP